MRRRLPTHIGPERHYLPKHSGNARPTAARMAWSGNFRGVPGFWKAGEATSIFGDGFRAPFKLMTRTPARSAWRACSATGGNGPALFSRLSLALSLFLFIGTIPLIFSTIDILS